jgi:hypothetical protein
MNSVTTEAFRKLYTQAPLERRQKIRRAFQLWRQNPHHPSLRFKKIHATLPIYSARVDLDWRAVGVLNDGTLIWFWVGSHKAYELLLRSL